MAEALTLSKRALPNCKPNPPVGCVIVKDNIKIAEGFTQVPGHYHAEAAALAACTNGAKDASVFVTLEPCSFHGRTPSCAKALIEAGVKEVYVALIDPDPRNSGAGIHMLQSAGITVHVGILHEEVAAFLEQHLTKKTLV